MKTVEYKLEDFKNWLEASKASQGGMEEHWDYFLNWYGENPEIWEATVERGMRSAGYEQVKFGEWNDYDKEIENLYTTIFTWKREIDSKQKKYLTGYEQQEQLLSQIPIIKRSEEEIELRKEISQLKSDIRQKEAKNQENQDKIARLEQEKQSLNLNAESKESN